MRKNWKANTETGSRTLASFNGSRCNELQYYIVVLRNFCFKLMTNHH